MRDVLDVLAHVAACHMQAAFRGRAARMAARSLRRAALLRRFRPTSVRHAAAATIARSVRSSLLGTNVLGVRRFVCGGGDAAASAAAAAAAAAAATTTTSATATTPTPNIAADVTDVAVTPDADTVNDDGDPLDDGDLLNVLFGALPPSSSSSSSSPFAAVGDDDHDITPLPPPAPTRTPHRGRRGAASTSWGDDVDDDDDDDCNERSCLSPFGAPSYYQDLALKTESADLENVNGDDDEDEKEKTEPEEHNPEPEEHNPTTASTDDDPLKEVRDLCDQIAGGAPAQDQAELEVESNSPPYYIGSVESQQHHYADPVETWWSPADHHEPQYDGDYDDYNEEYNGYDDDHYHEAPD